MDSYNTASGGTGTGSPMGDSVGRYPSGSPSLGTAGATSGGGIGVSNGSYPPNTPINNATPAGAGVSGTVTVNPNAATTGDTTNVPGRDRPTDATYRRTAPRRGPASRARSPRAARQARVARSARPAPVGGTSAAGAAPSAAPAPARPGPGQRWAPAVPRT